MRPTLIIATAAGFAALPILYGTAWAQANRTFVSGHGSDTNPCSLSAPCRSFAQALTQTNAGGEITILDPAGYGPVTINKAVSIVNDGVGEAGVTVTSATPAITIAVGASDVVNLRGLTLVGSGIGTVGVFFNNLGALNTQNCVIRGFVNSGVALEPQEGAQFNLSDMVVSNISLFGITVQPGGSGTVTASFNRVQVIGGGDGFFINGGDSTGAVDVTIANSIASNTANGITTQSALAMANTQVMVVNSVIANNGTGVSESGANSTTYLARNTIAGNTTAFSVMNSGALFSFGDNDVKTNGNDGGVITLVATK